MVLSIWTWMKQVTELWLTNSQLMLHMKYLLYSWLRIGVIEYKLQNKNIRSINMTSNLNVILSDIFCICSSSSYSWFSIFFKETCNHVITRKPTNFTQGGGNGLPPPETAYECSTTALQYLCFREMAGIYSDDVLRNIEKEFKHLDGGTYLGKNHFSYLRTRILQNISDKWYQDKK